MNPVWDDTEGPWLPVYVVMVGIELTDEFLAEVGGGDIAAARRLAEGSCCCDDDPDQEPGFTTGLRSDAPETWCLRCLASAAVDQLEGREPGSTVMQERGHA